MTTPARAVLAAAAITAALLGAQGSSGGPSAAAATGRFLVPRTPAIESLIQSGRVRLLESYGDGSTGRDLVEGPRAWLEQALASTPDQPPAREVRSRIHLRGRDIDTAVPRLAAPAVPAGGHLEVIQLDRPVREGSLALLREGGARPVAYLPHDAWIVWVEDGGAALTSGLRWREPLAEQDKLSPALAGRDGDVDVTVQVLRAGRHDEAVDGILSGARLLPGSRVTRGGTGPFTHLRLRTDAGRLAGIAAHPEVVWIEPFDLPVTHDERAAQIAAGHVIAGRPLGPGYEAFLEAHGMSDLSRHIVDVTDTGIDTGIPERVHPGLRGRLAYVINSSPDADPQDCAGHGTLMAGIIAGAGEAGGGEGMRDADGYLLGLGMAPTARVGATRIFDCAGDFTPSRTFQDILTDAWERGARIGNNSWGGLGPQYNTVSAEYDALVRDVNLDPSDGDQAFLPVFSAGNFGPLVGSVGWPATAKNVLSVGATENLRPAISDGCGASTLEADNIDHVLSYSSRGPTGDGRLKPDLVAPGSHVYGPASSALDYDASGVCDPYHPPGQRRITWATGTSQAAAHATGGAVLAAEVHFRETGLDPSPAMMKAMLINHAHDMMGLVNRPSNTGPRPNGDQGWGRLDVGSLLEERARVFVDQTHVLRGTGEAVLMEPFLVEDPARPVVITLAWTDAPGTPGGWAWVNDLDLVVRSGGTALLGNHLDRGVSVPGGSPDERNNVEMVVLPAGSSLFSVEVAAARLAGDGVPSIPGETDQDFALYVSNARLPVARADVSLPPLAACGVAMPVVVTDAGIQGLGRAEVLIAAGSDRETMTLQENPPGTGRFSATLDVVAGTAAAEDGRLQISAGTTVSATYLERDDTAGATVPRSATAPGRCGPPVLDGVRVDRVGDTEAIVRWDTDRPATGTVMWNAPGSAPLVRTDSRLLRRHEARLTSLAPCTAYTVTLTSTDEAGQSVSSAPGEAGFVTGAGGGKRRTLFRDDMEGLVSRWSHRALPSHAGAVDDWQLGIPLGGFPLPPSGLRVWKTRLTSPLTAGLDAVLESPPIDLRDAVAPQLSFRHIYALSGGRPPDSHNDGAWVEISADDGATWSPIDPAGGYPDSIDEDNPYIAGGSGVYAGVPPSWAYAQFDLSHHEGSVIRLRFHVWQDAAENNPLLAGWAIDDVEVTAEGACHDASLRLDAEEYGCASQVEATLWDPDLNRSASTVESATATVQGPEGSLVVSLQETAASSGEFRGTFRLGSGPGRLAVQEGDLFTVRAGEAQGEPGPPAPAVSAVVPDCAPPPPPAGIRVMPDTAGRLDVFWDPIPGAAAPDLQGYRVHYDSDASGPLYTGTGAMQGASPVRSELAAATQSLGGLATCRPHFVTVTAFDRLGNESAFGSEALGVPPGTGTPCGHGRVLLSPETPACGQTLAITVSDANADPDAGTAGTVIVTAASPAQPGGMAVPLGETAPASGTFTGGVLLAPAESPGALAARTGEDVVVTYQDASDGLGVPRAILARVTAGDCDAPLITQIRVTGRTADRAVVRWTTDEPATSRVRFGADPALPYTIENAALVTDHAMLLTGLGSCGTIHYEVSSRDAAGNTAVLGGPGSGTRFGTWRDLLLFTDDFEQGAPGWLHRSMKETGTDEWELGAPADGPGLPPSGTHAWGVDLDGPYEDGADIVLVSPPIDLGFKEAITLSFVHWYDVYTSGSPDGFDDGAFVEITDDGGATWQPIQPLEGYPDRISGTPYAPFGSGAWAGQSPGWVNAAFALDAWSGRVVQLRFHLLEDPLERSVTRHAGWYLDDVRVTYSLACREATLAWDRESYGCGTAPARLRLMDQDLDTPGTDSVMITVRSQGEPAGEAIRLDESPLAGGVFEGEVLFSREDQPGVVGVIDGDTVVADYEDADDGTGARVTLQSAAAVGDCRPPDLLNVRVVDRSPTTLRVAWETSEPADSRVLYGPDAGLGLSVTAPDLTLQHDLTVTGLVPCSTVWMTVASADALGNLAREDETLPVRRVGLANEVTLMHEGFEAGAPSWVQTGEGGSWTMDSTGGGLARSTATSPYSRPPHANALFDLTSPGFDLAATQRPSLVLRHAWDFPASFQGGDGGLVEGWNGHDWVILEPVGGYPAFLDPEAGGTGGRPRGFGGVSAGFVTSRFDLTPLAGGRSARVRLRVFVENGVGPTAGGWLVDEARVTAELGCSEGRAAFHPLPITCAHAQAGIVLHDGDLDVTSSPDAAMVTVTSSGGGPAVPVTLRESAASGGRFEGTVALDPTGAGASLPRSAAGDQLRIVYLDADDGAGSPGQRESAVEVARCDAPVLRSLRASQTGADEATITWLTDQPATSRVTLTPAPPGGGAALTASNGALVTSHRMTVHGLTPCSAWDVSASSTTVTGATGSDAPATPVRVEAVDSTVLFFDDMEGPDPGWATSGPVSEWERGAPVDAPGAPFSGQNVWATDLDGPYNAGTDATLTSPPINLRGVSSARLTFWHYYDVFGNESPNSLDDAAWVEVLGETGSPVYMEPLGGYPDGTDQDGGRPLPLGKGVYAGISEDWEKAEFDLTPFVGQMIRLRFRVWNDQVELIINGRTGAGWAIDDVRVTAPRFCHPGPALASFSLPRTAQGTAAARIVITGTGLREGAVASLGAGVTLAPISASPTQLVCDLSTDPRAPLGKRDLTVILPDRQTATLPGALEVTFAPARADLNGSGRVDASDLAVLAAAFASIEGGERFRPEADLNGDGAVDGLDLALFASAYGLLFE